MAKTAKTQAKKPSTEDRGKSEALLATLQARFAKNPQRHGKITWKAVESQLDTKVLRALAAMEESGGEPDVVAIPGSNRLVFIDCSPESPIGRRSLCYDREAWAARKEARPKDTALDKAKAMGVELLDEVEYRALQMVGAFDTKTSSWIQTPPSIRVLGGALFCDRRYEQVFVYHNGAQSYYAARGFRAKLCV